jgi:pimeloyl-ACP methyl ester carboxylesterase
MDELLRTTIGTIALAAFGAAGAATAEDPHTPSKRGEVLSPCNLEEVAQPARCGVIEVPENPDHPDGRRLPIHVAVIPATSSPALPDPIVLLMGGPGEDAISAAGFFAKQFAALRGQRDIVLIDQRGTGQSAALRCELYSADDPARSLRDVFPPAAVEACSKRLQAQADLTRYSYAHFARDLEFIRRTLGYGPLNLNAGSYGTRAAQVFMRAYPKSVRTAYLHSIVPIDIPIPLPTAKAADGALDATFEACAADPACQAAFPDLRAEFRDIRAQLESGTVRVAVPGRSGTAPLDRGRVAEWFRSLLYRPGSAAQLPWLIHRAHQGDWNPIAAGILEQARGVDSGLSFGLFFSITCNEDLPFIAEADIVRETRGTFERDYRIRQQQAACSYWPKASLPKDYRLPVHSTVPALFASGDTDGGSPLWFTGHAAPGFSNRVEVVLRGKGHTEWTDCITGIYERFVRSGSTHDLQAASCKAGPRPPFKTH